MANERLSGAMSTVKFDESPTARADRLAVWVLLVLGLLLMLVSAGKAEQGTATRTESVSGTLTAGQTVQVQNVSGEIVAAPGRQFAAAITVTVSAPTQKQADELLRNTRIVQSHDEDGWSLETRWPGMHGRGDHGRGSDCPRCRVVARYELTLPPGVDADLQTVNGDVHVQDLDGELKLESVNGSIEVRGTRKSLDAQSVNGGIQASAQALPSGETIELQSVNGPITLTLPKDAQFDFSAETMNGTIASTFPLAAARGPLPPSKSHKGETPPPSKDKDQTKEKHARRIVVTDEEGETNVVDLDELDAELAESMPEYQIEIEEGMRETDRELRRIRVPDPLRQYSGSIGRGGAQIRIETLNGAVLLLAAGTKEADAKPLVSERREFVVTVPKVHVNPKVKVIAPVPPVPPAPPAPAVPPSDYDGEVVRGDISGDFLSTTAGGSYRVGKVSGRVRIVTHSGEIRVGGIGAGGELKTFGGDIILGPITGDLKASTAAGDIRIEGVTGSASLDTAGGDIRIQQVGGSLDARTSGGDIIAPRVGGGVRAVTAGGDVRIGATCREIRGGISISNSGGDVSLTIPPDCKADVELIVTGSDDDDSVIRSDFDLTVSRRSGTRRATATLNGGGEKIVVKTTSGSIRLRKGTGS